MNNIKYYNLLIIFLCIHFVNAQEYNPEINGPTEIVEIQGLKATDIQSRAMEWIALNYKSANDVVQLNSDNKIIVKGNFNVLEDYPVYDVFGGLVFQPVNLSFPHTLVISIKDEKYKIDMTFPEQIKVINLYDVDYFYQINEYTLRNEFTLEQRWVNVHNNLMKEEGMTEKKLQRKVRNLESGGRIVNNYNFQKNVSTKLNDNINTIFGGLIQSISSSSDW